MKNLAARQVVTLAVEFGIKIPVYFMLQLWDKQGCNMLFSTAQQCINTGKASLQGDLLDCKIDLQRKWQELSFGSLLKRIAQAQEDVI